MKRPIEYHSAWIFYRISASFINMGVIEFTINHTGLI